MIRKTSKNAQRKDRHARLRKRVVGTVEKPRMSVFRSDRHVYVQLIDDREGKTLVSVNTLQESIKSKIKGEMSNIDIAALVGKSIAESAKKAGIEDVVFDRAGYKFHGRLAALANGAREAGLKF